MSSRKAIKTYAPPHLAHPEAAEDIERQARDRYAELGEQKYASALSSAEQAEMLRLQVYLDQAEAKFTSRSRLARPLPRGGRLQSRYGSSGCDFG